MVDFTDYNAPSFPFAPGYKGGSTSLAGAEAIAPSVPNHHALILKALEGFGANGAIGDTVADHLGWEKWRVRPRLAELRAMGKVVDSGMRRRSESGISVIVWVLPQFADDMQASGNG